MYWITGAGDKRPHERWAAPDGSVSGGRNLAILPLHGRVFLGKAKIPLGFAIHLGSRKVSGKWGRGRLDHGINALVNLSWISLTMHLRQWSCPRHPAIGPCPCKSTSVRVFRMTRP